MALTAQNEKPKGRGRPGHDWESLFSEWLKSGLPRPEFLRLRGINPRSGTAIKRTAHWEDALREAKDQVTEQYLASIGNKRVATVVENVITTPSSELAGLPGDAQAQAEREAAAPPPRPQSSWQKVIDWRANQANQDWKTSDTIRVHIGLVLKQALVSQAGVDGKREFKSTLRPSDLRQIAMAAAEVQRIQRLALGMSTDNIGIDDGHGVVEPEATPDGVERPSNVFVVEMSRGGKFMRARPRRAG